jgi:cell division transport system permease protein
MSGTGARRVRRESGAVQSKATLRDRIGAWRSHHQLVASESLRRMLSQPLASLLTWMVMGIALALPASLFIALENMQQLTVGWDGAARVSLFLRDTVTEDVGRRLGQRLAKRPDVASYTYISRQAALEEFSQLSGFGDLLAELPTNPLPAVVVLEPALGTSSAEAMEQLLAQIKQLPEVELAQMDLQWVERLYGLMALGKRVTLALALLLGLGVLLVAGNTIRLAIENRRDEILVVKLVGGTDAYVRRPFLYTGFWYGLGGSIVAWLLLTVAMLWLDGPVGSLAGLYDSRFELQGLGFSGTLLLAIAGVALGLSGAWLAVTRHLGAITPR